MWKPTSSGLLLLCLATVSSLGYSGEIPNSAHSLLQGGTFITFNSTTSSLEPIYDGYLLISDGTIVSISSQAPPSIPVGTRVFNTTGKIITPGFVDTHHHIWLTATRTILSNTTLFQYYYELGQFGLEAFKYTPEDVYLGQLFGIYESLDAGVTSIVDHAHHTWSPETASAGLNATIDSGARVWWSYTLQPVPMLSANGTYSINTDVPWQMEQLAEFSSLSPSEKGLTSIGVASDQLYLPEADVQQLFHFAELHNLSHFTTHYVGGKFQGGLQPIKLLDSYGLMNVSMPLLFAHSGDITQEEMDILRKFNKHIVVTVESEMHFGLDHQNTDFILDQGSMGLDGSNTFSGDMLTQLRIYLQFVRSKRYQVVLDEGEIPFNNPMSVEQVFLLGTRNGGLALNRPDIGVLQAGAVADIVVFDTDRMGLLGWQNPIATVVLHANQGDIDTVIVGGVVRKEQKKLTNPPSSELKQAFLQRQKQFLASYYETNFTEFKIGLYGALGVNYSNEPILEDVDVVRGTGTGY